MDGIDKSSSDAENDVSVEGNDAESPTENGEVDGPISTTTTDAESGEVDRPTNAATTDAESDAESDATKESSIDATIDNVINLERDAASDSIASTPVVPILSGTVYTFAFADTTFAMDAAIGARIVTFALSGRNILTNPATGDPSNYGSTLWPSPQSDWNWPPPTQIDPGPYVGSVVGGRLSLTSATSPTLGLAVTKEVEVDSDAGLVTLRYGLVNHGTQARSFAPWEITRVAAGGLTFFPMGDGVPSKGGQDLLNLKIVDGVAWFAYDAKIITNDQKVFADGQEGWIAHVNGDLLLVKSFADTTPAEAAPGEAEIEIYTNAGHTYIEIENQGAYTDLAPEARSVWPVRWFLRKLDPAVSVTIGSPDLLSVVRALVSQ